MRKKSGDTNVIWIMWSVFIIVIVLVVCGYFIYDKMQYNVLAKEISKINSERVVDLEIKSKGKYEDLEKAIKEYANEYYSNVNILKELYSQDSLKTMLSIDNISNDGPNFDNSKAITANFVSQQNNVKNKLQEIVTEEYLNKKADEYSLYGKNRELFFSTLDLKEDASKIIEVIDSYEKFVNSIDNILNFLRENQSKWSIKDGKLMFKNVDLLNNYNSLVTTQKEVQTMLNSKLSDNGI